MKYGLFVGKNVCRLPIWIIGPIVVNLKLNSQYKNRYEKFAYYLAACCIGGDGRVVLERRRMGTRVGRKFLIGGD